MHAKLVVLTWHPLFHHEILNTRLLIFRHLIHLRGLLIIGGFSLLWLAYALANGLTLGAVLVVSTVLCLNESKELKIVLNLYFRSFSNRFRPYSVSELPLKVHKARVALTCPIEALTQVDAIIGVFGLFREGKDAGHSLVEGDTIIHMSSIYPPQVF